MVKAKSYVERKATCMRISKTRTYPCLLVPYVVHQPTPVILLEEPSRRSQRPYEIHDALGYLWFISLGRVNVQHLLRVDQIAKAFVSSVVVGSASPTAEDGLRPMPSIDVMLAQAQRLNASTSAASITSSLSNSCTGPSAPRRGRAGRGVELLRGALVRIFVPQPGTFPF